MFIIAICQILSQALIITVFRVNPIRITVAVADIGIVHHVSAGDPVYCGPVQ